MKLGSAWQGEAGQGSAWRGVAGLGVAGLGWAGHGAAGQGKAWGRTAKQQRSQAGLGRTRQGEFMNDDIGRFRKVILPSPRILARMKEQRWATEIELLCEALIEEGRHAPGRLPASEEAAALKAKQERSEVSA